MKRFTAPHLEGDPSKAKIVFIGDAPRSVDVVAGRPLTGPAGKVFDKCLHQGKISRSECCIINIFYEAQSAFKGARPQNIYSIPEDDYFRTLDLLKKVRKDAILVPLGNTALNLICDSESINQVRGTPMRCTFEKLEFWCIPTIHPFSVLRGQHLLQYFIAADMKKIHRWAGGQGGIPSRDYIISPTTEQAVDYLDRMSKVDQYAWDVEIWHNQISCVSFAPSPWEAISIPFIDMHQKDRSYFSEKDEAIVWKYVNKALYSENDKIGQNLMFDASWMFHFHNCLMRGEVKDTMIAHHVMYPDFPKGLDFLASIYTDEPYYKEDRKLWKKLHVDQERFWLYNAKDSAVTFECWEGMENELVDYIDTYNLTIDLFYPLLYLIERGLKVDNQRLSEAKVKISKEAEEKREELAEISDWAFNPTSPKQCQEYFYVTKGIKPYINRSTGKISCDDKALQRLATTHQLREASLTQEIRYLEKLSGTYLNVELDPDGRLRCFWNPRGTSTGRLSSSKTLWGSGLNLQNLHPAFRDFIIAE